MKNTILNLLIVFTSTNVFAFDYSQMHNANYNATNSFCGIHVEVSGQQLFITEIIPPNKEHRHDLCSPSYSFCTGDTEVVNCDNNGYCYSLKNRKLRYVVNQNGNLAFIAQPIYYTFSNQIQYKTCSGY